MDNPIKLIKNGILSADWSIVCRGYKDLTGETVEPKEALETANYGLMQQIEELLAEYRVKRVGLEDLSTPLPEKQKKKSVSIPPQAKAPKTGYYGNITVPLTDDNIPKSEVKINKEKATITNQRKAKREAPQKYDATCGDCKTKFKSDRPDTKDFGQKCKKCLQNLISNRGASGN